MQFSHMFTHVCVYHTVHTYHIFKDLIKNISQSSDFTSDFAEPRCFVLQKSDLDLRNVDNVGIQDKLEIHMTHHTGLGQHQLKHMLVPTGAAERTWYNLVVI